MKKIYIFILASLLAKAASADSAFGYQLRQLDAGWMGDLVRFLEEYNLSFVPYLLFAVFFIRPWVKRGVQAEQKKDIQ